MSTARDVHMPRPIRALPRNKAGLPVPWFVAEIPGEPDFRVAEPSKIVRAVKERLCWVCGQRRTRTTTRI